MKITEIELKFLWNFAEIFCSNFAENKLAKNRWNKLNFFWNIEILLKCSKT